MATILHIDDDPMVLKAIGNYLIRMGYEVVSAESGEEAEALFEDVREFGTKVCTIKPGWVNTPLVQKNEGIDPALMIQPEDIAQTVLFLISMAATACPTEITILPQRSPYTS